ncbi:MAG: hypothetical protein EP149_09640 [Phascolarctobacterium sp.]|nr:hypothetical protein [Phascolarctobacterium sp.]MUU07905.1 hypothetical protein [Phascolarctobacterium sp.]MUU17548.1 hypothetical protein [Phascolarctobacterium sp.]
MGKTKLGSHNANLNTLVPSKICDHCGKVFSLPWGSDFKDYAYRKYKGRKWYIYCSWSCLRAAEKIKTKKAGSWSEKRRAAALERQRKQLMTILPHYEQGCTIAEIRDLTGIAYATIQQRLSEYKKVLNNG